MLQYVRLSNYFLGFLNVHSDVKCRQYENIPSMTTDSQVLNETCILSKRSILAHVQKYGDVKSAICDSATNALAHRLDHFVRVNKFQKLDTSAVILHACAVLCFPNKKQTKLVR